MGEFKEGRFHGTGVMVERASGERYQGEFRNGLKHGKGKMIKMIKNGKVEYDGEWIEG